MKGKLRGPNEGWNNPLPHSLLTIIFETTTTTTTTTTTKTTTTTTTPPPLRSNVHLISIQKPCSLKQCNRNNITITDSTITTNTFTTTTAITTTTTTNSVTINTTLVAKNKGRYRCGEKSFSPDGDCYDYHFHCPRCNYRHCCRHHR